ncbi:MAG: ISKra4 family transposase [Deltaproteobacteria bacterium]|nr:MAG: ISKra4 family transposase [Deltaproteobacteria bacterium]
MLERPLREYAKVVAAQVREGERGRRVDQRRFAARLAERTAALERAGHAVALAALDIDAPHVQINGERYARVGRYPAPYKTAAGPVEVERSLYRRCGCSDGKTVNTVTLRSGAVADEWLPETAQQMAHLLQQGTSREAEQTARRMGRLPYSRSSFERIGHAVGEQYTGQHHEVEEALIRSVAVPEAAVSVSLSLDRVSVPMEEPRPRPPGRPRKNAPKRPVSRTFRMAYCGTVTLHDAEGQAMHTVRYGAMPESGPEALVTSMAGDVVALREQRPDVAVMKLCDGAAEMWNLLDAALDEETFGRTHSLVDFWHLVEKLSPAANVLYGDEAGATVTRRWKARLLNCNAAAAEILDELMVSGRQHVRVGKNKPVHEAVTSLANHRDRMRYAAARRRGLPIGSGNVEATCKSLVAQRMKRAGSRWKTITGDHVLHLRALSLSDRWDDAMAITLRTPPVQVQVA